MKKIFAILCVFIIFIVGCSSKQVPLTPTNTAQSAVNKPVTISLYFSDKSGKLVKESRQITLLPNEVLGKKIIEELIKGPSTQNLSPTISPSTKVNSVTINNATAIVDLSEEYISKSPGGTASEELAIYSVVNTLTDLINVDKVQFMIDGKVRKFFDQMEFSGPFERDNTIIKTI